MSAQIGILGFVNHAHSTPAELPEDAVVRDGLANHDKELLLGGHVRRRAEASQRTVIFDLAFAWVRCTPFYLFVANRPVGFWGSGLGCQPLQT